MKQLNKAIIILALVLVTACSSVQEKPVVTTINTPVYHPPLPAPVTMRGTEWVVLNRDTLESILKTAKEENKEIVFFALTSKNYENLSINIADVKRYLEQLREIVNYYRDNYPTTPIKIPEEN